MNTAQLVNAASVSFVLLFATTGFCQNISLYVLPGKQQKYLWSSSRQEGSNAQQSEVILAETFTVVEEGQYWKVTMSNATVCGTSIEYGPSKSSTNNISQHTLSSDTVDLKLPRGTKIVFEQKLQNLVDLKAK